jgi:hypothetical protein
VKIRKKTVMLLSFALGSIMFATTAMAEVASKSGYERLKDGFKFSSKSCSEKLSNYTMNMSIVVKDGDKIVEVYDNVNKYDRLNEASESTTTSTTMTVKKVKDYSYTDKNGYISYNADLDTYFVTEAKDEKRTQTFRDPFKEKSAGDVEKIFDALIGNLKDAVVVSTRTDGSKELSGSLSEAQIPAIANALVSFELKNQLGSSYNAQKIDLAKISSSITKDIYVKQVKGNMVLTKDGLIQSVLGTVVLSGKDEKGTEHNLTFELLGKLVDVGLTKVNKPDLSGKNVKTNIKTNDQTNVQINIGANVQKLTYLKKYVGTYKNDMIIEKDGKFQKIGEAIVDISSIDNNNIAGRYHEEYNKGFEEFAANKKDFKFNGKSCSDPFIAEFASDSSSSKVIKGNICINPGCSSIQFDIRENANANVLRNGQFSRVFN